MLDKSNYQEWLIFMAKMEAYDEEEEAKEKELKEVLEKIRKAKSDAGAYDEAKWIEPSTFAETENPTPTPAPFSCWFGRER